MNEQNIIKMLKEIKIVLEQNTGFMNAMNIYSIDRIINILRREQKRKRLKRVGALK